MIITSLRGNPVDTTGDAWRVDHQTTIRFYRTPFEAASLEGMGWHALNALKAYARHLLPRCSPMTVLGRTEILMALVRNPAIVNALTKGGPQLLIRIFELIIPGKTKNTTRLYLATFRNWYRFSAEACLPGFDLVTASAMDEMKIKGQEAGRAVLRLDPSRGPVPNQELEAFEAALWQASDAKSLPLRDLVAALTMLELGPNPESLRRLLESDLQRPASAGQRYALLVPSIKRHGVQQPHDELRSRPLSSRLGRLMEALIDENRSLRARYVDLATQKDFPLFHRRLIKQSDLCEVHDEYFWNVSHNFFKNATKKLGTWFSSLSQHAPLDLTPRRLRYSFATRAVAAGATPSDLMQLLDHSDIQTGMVYHDVRLDIVRHLDERMGDTLALVADVFMHEPCGSVHIAGFDRTVDEASTAAAPLACLSCALFRPTDATELRELARCIDLVRPGMPQRQRTWASTRARALAAACEAVRESGKAEKCGFVRPEHART